MIQEDFNKNLNLLLLISPMILIAIIAIIFPYAFAYYLPFSIEIGTAAGLAGIGWGVLFRKIDLASNNKFEQQSLDTIKEMGFIDRGMVTILNKYSNQIQWKLIMGLGVAILINFIFFGILAPISLLLSGLIFIAMSIFTNIVRPLTAIFLFLFYYLYGPIIPLMFLIGSSAFTEIYITIMRTDLTYE